MINKTLIAIFQQGSRTYFYSSLFFPPYLKKDVFGLYGFVRKADNFVDTIPQNKNGFYNFKNKYLRAIEGKLSGDIVVDNFVELMQRKNIKKEWVDAFFKSMEMDLKKSTYHNIDETLEYIYGSAEVIGLIMAQIMELPQKTHSYAKKLGRAMQYINFIRDINEDLTLGRTYLPSEDLTKFDLPSLELKHTEQKPEAFKEFILHQLNRYFTWQEEAEQGYKYIKKRYLIPVKTASEMYYWTAEQIHNNPFVVYQWKVKPLILRIITTTISNLIDTSTKKYKTIPNHTSPITAKNLITQKTD